MIFSDGSIVSENFSVHTSTYIMEALTWLSSDVFQLNLKPKDADSISYCAGQYLEILHKDWTPKPFSIANAPVPNGCIELHVRHWPENAYTTFLLHEFKAQSELRLAAPYGCCVYRSEPAYPLILLAGGTGFAPYKALLEQAISLGMPQSVYLYWGAKTVADLYLHSLVKAWSEQIENFHYIPVLSAPLSSDQWQGRAGWVHEAVLADHASLARYHIYASGPSAMVYAAQDAFLSQGMPKALMYSDWFTYSVT